MNKTEIMTSTASRDSLPFNAILLSSLLSWTSKLVDRLMVSNYLSSRGHPQLLNSLKSTVLALKFFIFLLFQRNENRKELRGVNCIFKFRNHCRIHENPWSFLKLSLYLKLSWRSYSNRIIEKLLFSQILVDR